MNMFNRIAIIGLGYIGLPTAVAFAQRGKSVQGVDINSEVVAKINQGRIHIVEPQLESAVKQGWKTGYFLQPKLPPLPMRLLLPYQRPFHTITNPICIILNKR